LFPAIASDVIATEATQSSCGANVLECFVARAPRNDGAVFRRAFLFVPCHCERCHCERSEAIQLRRERFWIASSLAAPRNDGARFSEGLFICSLPLRAMSLRAKRSNPVAARKVLDCFVARAPRNDGARFYAGALRFYLSSAFTVTLRRAWRRAPQDDDTPSNRVCFCIINLPFIPSL